MKVNLLRSPKALTHFLLKTHIKQLNYNMKQLPSIHSFTTTGLQIAALEKTHEILGGGKESHNNKLQFSTMAHLFSALCSQGRRCTRNRLIRVTTECTYPSWSSLFLTLNPHLTRKISCSFDSTHHQTKAQQVTKSSAELHIAEKRMLYMETRSQLLSSLLLCIHRGTCLFSFGPFSAQQIPVQEPSCPVEGMHTSQNQ